MCIIYIYMCVCVLVYVLCIYQFFHECEERFKYVEKRDMQRERERELAAAGFIYFVQPVLLGYDG